MTHPVQHWLIYGDAGAGKTTAASTFPKPQLVFQFDPIGKETPYLRRGEVFTFKEPDGTVVREVKKDDKLLYRIEHYLDRDATKPEAYQNFLKRLTTLERDIEAVGFQTVVLDSVTFMELMARKLSQYKLNPTSREPRQWFAASTDTLEEILMIRFGSLAINVVVLAHIDDSKVTINGTNVLVPAAPGRLARRGPGGFSEVYRAYSEVDEDGNRNYYWQTRSNAMYVASSQVNAPDPCPSTYSAIWTPT